MQWNIEIENKHEMNAFGAFIAGTTEGTIKIKLNIEDTVLAIAGNTENNKEALEEFYYVLSETSVHEMLHVFQELYKQRFDEDQVNDAISQAREYLKNENIDKPVMCENIECQKPMTREEYGRLTGYCVDCQKKGYNAFYKLTSVQKNASELLEACKHAYDYLEGIHNCSLLDDIERRKKVLKLLSQVIKESEIN